MKYYWRGKDPKDIPHVELVEAFNIVCQTVTEQERRIKRLERKEKGPKGP